MRTLETPGLDHVLLTRFNLPTPGVEELVRAQDGWLRDRVALFERYCLPSVRAQTSQHFRWLCYFDPDSPTWLRDKTDAWAARGVLTPVFRGRVGHADLLADLRRTSGARGTQLLTTNLDNDDGLAIDFVERLQAVRTQETRTAVYFVRGLIRSERGLYARSDPDNAFCSVLEDWDEPRTCWSDWHNLLGRTMPTHRIDGAPAWLQVVHGGNVSNRVRGRLVHPAWHRSRFPGAVEDLPAPGRVQLLTDRLVTGPVRLGRDRARGAFKAALMRAGGKAGLDRAKLVRARVSQALVGGPPRPRDRFERAAPTPPHH